jgi:EmrB/QacA subfamily drug resistance transporter
VTQAWKTLGAELHGAQPQSKPSPRERTHEWFPRRHRMLPVVLVAMFMAQFDLYVVNVALPVLQHDLKAGAAELQLIVGGYAFAYAAGLITGGRLGDIIGHRRMFILGMAGFGVASLLCGVSTSGTMLVWFRLLQGLTAAAMVPQVLALITSSFPPAEQPKALSWFGFTIGVGAVAGQIIGGALLQANVAGLGWRVIFFVNVPIALITVPLALRNLPLRETSKRARLDIPGVVGVTASLGLLLFGLIVGRSQGWPWWSWATLIASVPVMAAALAWERRLERAGGTPILSLQLFSEKAFNLGLLLSFVLLSAFFSFVFCMSLVLQHGIGLDPLHAGLTFGPGGIGFAVAAIVARPYVQKFGARVIVVGTVLVTVAFLAVIVLANAHPGSLTAVELAIPMTFVAIGNGIAVPALIGQVLARIPPTHAGAASGVLATAQQFSSTIGIVGVGGVFFAALGARGQRADYASSLVVSSMCDLALVAVAALLALRLERVTRPATV